MNEIIINNLFEFWSYIGLKNNIYSDFSNYKTVSVVDSDWPNRIYAIESSVNFEDIIQLSNQDLLPNIITLHYPIEINDNKKMQLLFSQSNMALDMLNYSNEFSKNQNIYQIENKAEAFDFAKVASESFGYRVDGTIIYNLSKDSSSSKLFVFKEKKESYGCGILFFDKSNTAGFHMIGTIPSGRGKGVGKSITEKLINEAFINGSKYCVLNASKMGESIYKKLGFTTYGLLDNYLILK